MKELIHKIHASPFSTALAITGGGTEAISELLRYGGGSTTILEAIIPYNQKAFDNFVRGKPDKYCSPGAARDLAMAAFQRAVEFANTSENIIGVGASCSLVKDVTERAGREHHVYIATQTEYETVSYTLSLHGHEYNREQEEKLAATAIVEALGVACKINCELTPESKAVASPQLRNLILGEQKVLTLGLESTPPYNKKIIFPGAFNPLHEQHANMAAKVAELFNQKVDLELCVRNVDKPALNYLEIEARIAQLKEYTNSGWLKDLHLTSTPTFAEKALAFPFAKFLVGWDTFRRINDPKYGDLEKVIKIFQSQGTHFLVFHRIMNGKSSAEENIDHIHPKLLEITTIFPKETLPPVEISSTEIRKRATQ